MNELLGRFFSRVEVTEGCWNWRGAINRDGYGTFSSPQHLAHRYSWAYYNMTDIPKGGVICHRCDNPRCVNPDHLYFGDHQENQRDKVAKHRQARGERQHSAKLTEEKVREIRASDETLKVLADRFGVRFTTIHHVRTGKTWRHVT